jgi:hypothetical protein
MGVLTQALPLDGGGFGRGWVRFILIGNRSSAQMQT